MTSDGLLVYPLSVPYFILYQMKIVCLRDIVYINEPYIGFHFRLNDSSTNLINGSHTYNASSSIEQKIWKTCYPDRSADQMVCTLEC